MKIDLPYIYRDVDWHGTLRLYARKRGHKKFRIRSYLDAPDFRKQYDEAVALMLSNAKDQAPDAPPAEGTLGWLMLRYFASNAFKKLDPITQRTKRSILEKAAAEPTKPGGDLQFKHIPLSVLEPKHVKIMRDRKKDLPGAANNRVSEMRVLLSWGLEEEDEHVKRNVAKDVKMLDYKEKAFHQWTESELDKFEKRHPRGVTSATSDIAVVPAGQYA